MHASLTAFAMAWVLLPGNAAAPEPIDATTPPVPDTSGPEPEDPSSSTNADALLPPLEDASSSSEPSTEPPAPDPAPTAPVPFVAPLEGPPTPPPPVDPAAPDWDRADDRLRRAVIGTAVLAGVTGAAATVALIFNLPPACFICQGQGTKVWVATSTALAVPSITAVSLLAGLRRTVRRVRTWTSGDPEQYYRRTRRMALFGIGAAAGAGIAFAGAAISEIYVCSGDQCYAKREWVVTTPIGATIVAGSLIGLGITAAQRRRFRGSSEPRLTFTGTGLAGRF